LFRILQARAVSGLQERIFNSTFGDLTIYVEDVSTSQVALRGILVSDERDPTLSRIISAREGRLLTDESNRRITLRMMNGAVNEADIVPVDVPKTTVDTPSPTGGAAGASRYRYTRFDIYDMSLSVDSPLKGAPRVEKPEKDLSLPDLGAKIAEYRNDPHSRAPFEIERHKRYALPIAALVFGLVAFPLAIRSHRGGRSIALVGSLAILVTYYLTMTSLQGAALRTRIRAAAAIGLAVAAALFIVIDLVKTLDKYLRVKPPLMYILEHFAYRLPAALHDGLPVVMLVATIFLFLTLSRYHELTALKAAGVSLYRVS